MKSMKSWYLTTNWQLPRRNQTCLIDVAGAICFPYPPLSKWHRPNWPPHYILSKQTTTSHVWESPIRGKTKNSSEFIREKEHLNSAFIKWSQQNLHTIHAWDSNVSLHKKKWSFVSQISDPIRPSSPHLVALHVEAPPRPGYGMLSVDVDPWIVFGNELESQLSASYKKYRQIMCFEHFNGIFSVDGGPTCRVAGHMAAGTCSSFYENKWSLTRRATFWGLIGEEVCNFPEYSQWLLLITLCLIQFPLILMDRQTSIYSQVCSINSYWLWP